MNETFEYIVAGAGSAGCVVAARLSERGYRVLLLEAGREDRGLYTRVPAAIPRAVQAYSWAYASEPDANTSGRSIPIPQGRVLGGSSSINGMLYIRGELSDYDRWEEQYGCEGWNAASALQYFRRTERNSRLRNEEHGGEGVLAVEDTRYQSPISRRFLNAAVEAGLPLIDDLSTMRQGVGFFQTTTRAGVRWNTPRAFIGRGNPNLTVRTGAAVQELVIERGRAVGVRYQVGNAGVETAYCDGEVIVSAGGIGSAKTLMLSGIGPADHLREHGIKVVADLPTGHNFQDHPTLGLTATTTSQLGLFGSDKGLNFVSNGLKWLIGRRGPYTSNVIEAGGALDMGGEGRTDVQIFFFSAVDNWLGNANPANLAPTDGYTLKFCIMRPKSRGRVLLRSADPSALPIVRANFLSDPSDVDIFVKSVKWGLKLLEKAPLKDVTGEMVSCRDPFSDDASIERYVRARVLSCFHPVGTCRMGPDPATSVIDPHLRVHGIEGLRVIDSSIFPEIPSGNTNAPTIMVGERGADLILQGSNLAAMAAQQG